MSNWGTKLRIEVTPAKMPSTTKLTAHGEAPTFSRKVARLAFNASKPCSTKLDKNIPTGPAAKKYTSSIMTIKMGIARYLLSKIRSILSVKSLGFSRLETASSRIFSIKL